jgi:tetratricopeptide (TPR) repeat protein
MYATAAEIAPSRALPHTSLGGVYMRLSRLDDALMEYAAAVSRSPHDEGALLGQADALATAVRPKDAANALDHVAEIQQASARLPEAADTLRRALELDESPERVHRQRALLREIRMSAGDRAAEQLLARALRLRDDPDIDVNAPRYAPPQVVPGRAATPTIERIGAANAVAESVAAPDTDLAATGKPADVMAPSESAVSVPTAEPGSIELVPAAAEFDAAAEPVAESATAADAPVLAVSDLEPVISAEPAPVAAEPVEVAAEAQSEPAAEVATEPAEAEIAEPAAEVAGSARESVADDATPESKEPRAVGVMAGVDELAADGSSEPAKPQPTGDELLAAAEAAEEAGDDASLRSLLLWTARAYAREGRFEAGLDTAHRLLRRSPADVDAHLALVELYVAQNWDGLAAEKLLLLGRLADLDGDDATRRRLCVAASRAFPGNERLQALCS